MWSNEIEASSIPVWALLSTIIWRTKFIFQLNKLVIFALKKIVQVRFLSLHHTTPLKFTDDCAMKPICIPLSTPEFRFLIENFHILLQNCRVSITLVLKAKSAAFEIGRPQTSPIAIFWIRLAQRMRNTPTPRVVSWPARGGSL